MSLSPETLLQWLESRRSIRRFAERPVSRGLLERILRTAGAAPSAHNSQPWRFVIVSEGTLRRRLADRMAVEFRRDLEAERLVESEIESRISRAVDRVVSAPAAVVLCTTMRDLPRFADPRRIEAERVMSIQSTSAAGGQLLLAAHAEGLGACWMCGPLFAPGAVRSALDLPDDWEPQALFVIGWPAESPSPRDRRSFEDVVVWR